MNSLLGTVTSVAGQVTSTVREMATEVMDTEREIRHERQQSQQQEHAVARLAPEAETTAASTSASANGVAVAGLPETNGKPPPLKDAQQQQPSASLASLKARLERERSRASKQHELLDRIRDRRAQPPPTASEPKVLPPPVAAPAPTPQPRPAEAAAAIPPIPPQPQQQQQQQQQQELIDRLERTLLDVKRQTQEREEIWKGLVRDKDAALASLAAKHEAAVNATSQLEGDLRSERSILAAFREEAASRERAFVGRLEEAARDLTAANERESEREREEQKMRAAAPALEAEAAEARVTALEAALEGAEREKQRLTTCLLEKEADEDDQYAHYEAELTALRSQTQAATQQSDALQVRRPPIPCRTRISPSPL